MPIPAAKAPQSPRSCAPAKPGEGISLPVIDPRRHIKKSKVGKWRAAVLILVQLAIAGHITLWVLTGMRRTLSPVEPSESMSTLEQGLINAGFVFFALALLSTFVLGRFFCGWGCHIVALQDLCGWAMNKLGIRPKPFRSRLLVWAPLILALYMFVWPTFKREIVRPVLGEQRWAAVAPYIGEVGDRPQLKAAFTKKDFWATFPPWYVAVPFLSICGFACVYFLGNKGFCTYGCPYGGFFGPMDKIAPGRILVTDACEGCGHCTAVCSSNVRVHEEVRDYGMVVDPGCMKCLDCVSVCPNDALYFGFARPALFANPRPGGKKARKFKSRVYDLSLWEEAAFGILFFVLVLGFRKFLNASALLMAMGMAAVATFLAWKLLCLIRDQNVRIQNLQLKLKGRIKPWGLLFAPICLLAPASGLWGAWVYSQRAWADILDSRITAPAHLVLSANYTPDPAQKSIAERALAAYLRSAAPSEGGYGWPLDIDQRIRVAWFAAVAGHPEDALAHTRRALAQTLRTRYGPGAGLVENLAMLMTLRGQSPADVEAAYRDLIKDSHSPAAAATVRLGIAGAALAQNHPDIAITEAQAAAAARPDDPPILVNAAQLLASAGKLDLADTLLRRALALEPADMAVLGPAADIWSQTGHPDTALEFTQRALKVEPKNPNLHHLHAAFLLMTNKIDDGLRALDQAITLAPKNPMYLRMKAQVLRGLGRAAEAADLESRAAALEKPPSR